MAEANFESLNLEISVRASEAVTQIKDLTDALGGLKKVLGGMGALGSLGKGVENIAKKAEDTAQRVRQATQDIQDTVDRGGSSAALPTNIWGSKGAVEITEAADEVVEAQERIQEEAAQTQVVLEGALESAASSAGQASEAITNVGNSTNTASRAAFSLSDLTRGFHMARTAIGLMRKPLEFIVGQLKDLMSTVKKVKKLFDGLNEKFNPFAALKKELGYLLSLAKRQVLRRAINAAIKAITEGLREGVANLAQYDERFSATVQSFKNAMGLFKNSIGVAVAPIISYFIPALNQMLAALTAAMNTLARLTALLTGQHTYTVAKSYEEIGDSAGGASSAVKELQRTILGFDEINKLNRPSGSGGGGGGGAGDAISAYETLSVGDWPYSSWGEALEAFLKWLNGSGVPKLREGFAKVASVVNNFSRGLYDALTYGNVQEYVAELGKNIGSALNNFLNGGEENGGLNWADMGKAIGMGIQTAFNFAANFFRNFSFFELGASLAEFFNNAIQQLKPEDIADTLYSIFTAGIKMAFGFLLNADLPSLGVKLAEFVNRVVQNIADDVHNVKAQSWQQFWNNIADGILRFVHQVDWDTLFGTANEIIDGLYQGLTDIIDKVMGDKRVQQAIRRGIDLLIKIALNWFKLKLRALAMAIGGYISELLNGFLDEIAPFGTSTESIGRSSIMSSEGWGLDAFEGDIEHFGDVVDDTADRVRGGFTGMGDSARSATRSIKGETDKIAASADQMAQNVSISGRNTVNAFRSMTTDSTKPLSDMASNVNTQFGKVNTSITTNMNTAKTNAVSAAEALRSSMATKMSQMSANASAEAENVRKAVVGKITETKNLLPAFTDVGKNIKDGIIGGMGDFKGKLDEWASQFKKRILDNFNIKSPSRWAEEFVGTYISEGIAVGMMDGSRSVEQACAGLKEGISSEFSNMSFVGNVRTGGIDIAGAIGNQVMAGVASMTTNNQQPIVCEVYLDRDKIATAVTRGQRAQNRRYSPTALAY